LVADAEAKLDTKAFERAMKKYPMRLYSALRKRVGLHLKDWVSREIKNKRFHGRPFLQTRSTTFQRSLDSKAYGESLRSLRFITGTVKQGFPYANIHETGGVIKAKPGKFLTIPLGEALTPSGVPRFSAKEVMDDETKDTAIIRTAAGAFIVHKRKTRWDFLFKLVKKVTIPARLGFHDAFQKQLPGLMREFNKASHDALKEERVA